MNRGSKVLKVLVALIVFIVLFATCNINTYAATNKYIQDMRIEINNNEYYTYCNEEIRPTVKVYDGTRMLKENKDYRLTYKYNVKPGKGRVKVSGIGEYRGKIFKYFYIAPKAVTIKSVTFNSSLTKAKIKWARDWKASGYKIYMSETRDGEYRKIKNITDNGIGSYNAKWLDPNKIYYFKVRAYKKVDGKQIMKEYSEPKSSTNLISKVTLTSPGSGADRNYNLSLACQTISGTVLHPGQTFDWFKVVGQASASKGYKSAIIFQGNKKVLGTGGGVCQVSTTLYQASRNIGLSIIERHQHSQNVSYTSPGNDATVYYGVHNLRIRNDYGYKVLIKMYANGGSTTCEIYRVE